MQGSVARYRPPLTSKFSRQPFFLTRSSSLVASFLGFCLRGMVSKSVLLYVGPAMSAALLASGLLVMKENTRGC